MAPHEPHDFLFYAPDLNADSTDHTLVAAEHRHLAQVLRARPGETVFVTNGRGLLVRATVVALGKDAAELRVDAAVSQNVETPLVIAIALLRKDAFELAVRQATECGATRFVPFVSERSHLRDYGAGFLERAERIAVAAMKQSFRSLLPAIDAPIPFEGLIREVVAAGGGIVADAGGESLGAGATGALGVIGPEAGLSEAERGALREAGCRFVRLSPHRLRAETAATLLAAALRGPQRGVD